MDCDRLPDRVSHVPRPISISPETLQRFLDHRHFNDIPGRGGILLDTG